MSHVAPRAVLSVMLVFVVGACQATIGRTPNIDASLQSKRVRIASGDGSRISGYLFRPAASEPRPAVIMLHGCSGMLGKRGKLKSRETAWRDIFLAEGYVVLLLDSFTDRGYRTICRISLSARPVEPDRERPHDAYGALRWLQTQPFVIPDRIALSGWSNGAMAMLWTVHADAPQRPKTLENEFRAALGFYPGCIKLRRENPRYAAAVPVLLQVGDADNWTWPGPCMTLVAGATSGAQIEIDTYENAVHAFDHPNSRRRTITVSGGRQVEIGTDPIARQKAIIRVLAYLREKFSD